MTIVREQMFSYFHCNNPLTRITQLYSPCALAQLAHKKLRCTTKKITTAMPANKYLVNGVSKVLATFAWKILDQVCPPSLICAGGERVSISQGGCD